MHTIVIANPRGGVGKSVTATSLAAAYAERGMRVGLYDATKNASASRAFGLRPVRHPQVAEPVEVQLTGLSGSITLLRGGILLGLPDHPYRFLMRQIDADIAIVDTAPTDLSVIISAVAIASLVLVPVDPDVSSVDGLSDMLDVQSLFAVPPELRILTTKADIRNPLAPQVRALLESRYADRLLDVQIPLDAACEEAATQRRPLLYCAPNALASRAYRDLIEELDPLLEDAASHRARPVEEVRNALTQASELPRPGKRDEP